ncbi:hypothetical protein [Desulfobacula phenolica]|uniref:Uncharacterized protein n=1 Tax=Desulfobacula phenolica TaxID=90732 RepID=A0A1H2EIK3_9BACT|nr:hypothetical protein [Desulfobacula phenolica]SDT94955.1 hypothetical protein SAMN04487931_103148 [Desulfobacula phenolica]
MSILHYFSQILSQKYPEEKVNIKIEQEDLKITMIIETEDGQKEKVEKELEKYGLVVLGKVQAEQYCEKPLEAIALKQKLEMAAIEVKHTKELMLIERNHYETRITSLEEVVHSMLKNNGQVKAQDININISNVGSPTITDNSSRNVTITNKTELCKSDKDQISDLIEILEKNLSEFKIGQDNEKKVRSFIKSTKKNLEKEKPDFFGLKDNMNSINNLLQGATGSLIASGLLPQIQNIISSIFN